MKPSLFRLLALAFAVGSLVSFAVRADTYAGACSFHFTSEVHRGPDFAGDVASQPFVATVATNAAGQPACSMALTVTVADMTTHDGGRDKDMRNLLHAGTFPVITGTVADVPLADIKAGKIPFSLVIDEIPSTLNGVVSDWQETDGVIAFKVAFTVHLPDYKLKGPTMFFMRVDDDVKLVATVTLSPKKG